MISSLEIIAGNDTTKNIAFQQHFSGFSKIWRDRHARRYRIRMKVHLKNLQAAHKIAALLVIEDPAYLPIFERVDREILELAKKDDIIQRAKEVAERYNAIA